MSISVTLAIYRFEFYSELHATWVNYVRPFFYISFLSVQILLDICVQVESIQCRFVERVVIVTENRNLNRGEEVSI